MNGWFVVTSNGQEVKHPVIKIGMAVSILVGTLILVALLGIPNSIRWMMSK